MRPWIILLRGINVGGHNKVPMHRLREVLEAAGFSEVRTYIQSGNIVALTKLDESALAACVSELLDKEFGVQAFVQVVSLKNLQRIAEANPFPEAEPTPKTLHVFFLDAVPAAEQLRALEELCANDERIWLGEGALYLHAPAGIGRSKLVARVEPLLRVQATSRNWNTVTRLLELA